MSMKPYSFLKKFDRESLVIFMHIINLIIVTLFILVLMILGITLFYHWKVSLYNKKLQQKKGKWENKLFEYLGDEKSIDEISDMLGDDYKILKDFLTPYLKNLRGEDYEKLVELAQETGVTPYYLRRLEKGGTKEKIRAANFLGKVKERKALPALEKILHQDDSDEMIAAAWSIAEIGDKQYFSPVLKEIINNTHMTYEGITELLTQFDREICGEIEDLLTGWLEDKKDLEEIFQSSKDIIISLLIDLLGHFNYFEGIYLLEDTLRKESNTEVIIHIFKALVKIGYPIENDLKPYLHHENWVIRSQAVRYAGIIGEEKYLSDYKKLLKEDSNWWVKFYAGETIFKTAGKDILESLAQSQEDGSRMSSYILDQIQ